MGVKRNPLPGRSWRILAHYRNSSEDLYSRELARTTDKRRREWAERSPELSETFAKLAAQRRVLPQTCTFDELVLDDWLHLEQMNARAYWMRLGDAYVWIQIPTKGDPIVDIRRGEYGPVKGETEVPA